MTKSELNKTAAKQASPNEAQTNEVVMFYRRHHRRSAKG